MPNGLPDAGGTHTEQESHSWTIEIPDHEKRTESSEYKAARKRMNELAKSQPE